MGEIAVGTHRHLAGDLQLPDNPSALVIFAHGSGSSRFSPRNLYVAKKLKREGFGTLLLDMLTPAEDQDPARRFDIDLLASRLEETLVWWSTQRQALELPIGLFGASTGAAAALVAATRDPGRVFAVVSRGGRPDLATDSLKLVRAPTLLIVGGDDPVVLDLNRAALRQLPRGSLLEVVPGATHLFEEPGKLEAVSTLACRWFKDHLPDPAARRQRS